jgi:hypothetical protein
VFSLWIVVNFLHLLENVWNLCSNIHLSPNSKKCKIVHGNSYKKQKWKLTLFATKLLCSGGTSVTGALECPENEKRMIVSVDMSQMVSLLRQFFFSLYQSCFVDCMTVILYYNASGECYAHHMVRKIYSILFVHGDGPWVFLLKF